MSSLVEDIDYLASIICDVVHDASIWAEARGIAQYMLYTRDMPMTRCIQLLKHDGSHVFINKLLDTASNFFDITPQTLGIHIGSELLADKIQNSLDVKHYKKSTEQAQSNCITPNIKMDTLHTNKEYVWLRVFSYSSDFSFITSAINVETIGTNVYELYVKKSGKKGKDLKSVEQIIFELDNNKTCIIFCSELMYFQSNNLLFLSNFIKFMYCYKLGRMIFNPKTAKELEYVNIYMVYAISFLEQGNMNSTSLKTHGPLIAYTGERPRSAYSKFDFNSVYVNEGTRAMQSINKPSDIGAKSNYIEIISELAPFSPTLLDNII